LAKKSREKPQDTRIVFFETEDWEEQYIKQSPLQQHEPKLFREPLTDQTAKLAEDARIVSAFIYSDINKRVLDQLPKLKMIATRSTGYDHIDVAECRRREISITNVPYYGENTVAEHAFGLILSLSRKIYKAYLRTSRLDFSFESLRGFDLKDKTIGVVGAGRIGLHVVRIAKGFGMEVLVYDVRHEPLLAEVLGFTYVSFEELLQRSDVITLHVPLTKATHHMINSENVGLIKRGALLINTARGGLVDEAALAKALQDGTIAGAGFDVLTKEPPKEGNVLLNLKMPNFIVTPHVAWASREAMQILADQLIDNIEAFVAGNPQNVVE